MSKGFFGFDYHSLMEFKRLKGISAEPVIFDLFEIADNMNNRRNPMDRYVTLIARGVESKEWLNKEQYDRVIAIFDEAEAIRHDKEKARKEQDDTVPQ